MIFCHNGSGDVFDVCPSFLYDDRFEGVGSSSFQRIEGFKSLLDSVWAVDGIE